MRSSTETIARALRILAALIVSPAQLAERIAEPGGWMLSNAELAAIAQAATARLAQRLIPTDQRRAA